MPCLVEIVTPIVTPDHVGLNIPEFSIKRIKDITLAEFERIKNGDVKLKCEAISNFDHANNQFNKKWVLHEALGDNCNVVTVIHNYLDPDCGSALSDFEQLPNVLVSNNTLEIMKYKDLNLVHGEMFSRQKVKIYSVLSSTVQ